MSIFDPHGYYEHKKSSTRKGQVIQKKPWKFWNAKCWSNQEKEIFLKFLNDSGYHVFAPGVPMPFGRTAKIFDNHHFYPVYHFHIWEGSAHVIPTEITYNILELNFLLKSWEPYDIFVNMDRNLIDEFRIVIGFQAVWIGGFIYTDDGSNIMEITFHQDPWANVMYNNQGVISSSLQRNDQRVFYLGGVPATDKATIIDSIFDSNIYADYEHLVPNQADILPGIPFAVKIDTFEDLDKLRDDVYNKTIAAIGIDPTRPGLITMSDVCCIPYVKIEYKLK